MIVTRLDWEIPNTHNIVFTPQEYCFVSLMPSNKQNDEAVKQ